MEYSQTQQITTSKKQTKKWNVLQLCGDRESSAAFIRTLALRFVTANKRVGRIGSLKEVLSQNENRWKIRSIKTRLLPLKPVSMSNGMEKNKKETTNNSTDKEAGRERKMENSGKKKIRRVGWRETTGHNSQESQRKWPMVFQIYLD